jgi:hypothetical protein
MDNDYTSQARFSKPTTAVLDALTTLPGLAGWWSSVTGDPSVGGELQFMFDHGTPLHLHVDEVTPAFVQWTCIDFAPLPEWKGTVISFELRDLEGGGSQVSFRHQGLTPQCECFGECSGGWNHFIPSLRQYVDTGVGSPFKSEADTAHREARALAEA